MEVVAQIEGQVKIFSDGSVLCLPRHVVPASSQFTDGVASKDVIVNPEIGVWARIFKPKTAAEKSPLLIHFHRGGFISCSSAWEEFHTYFHVLCKTAGIMIVAVDYRLAPEHRLPTTYDDCMEAVEWIGKHATGRAEPPEEWLSVATVDYSRCFLAGDSSEGNVVYNVALRVADVDVKPLVVKAVICIHPFFSSDELIESEKKERR